MKRRHDIFLQLTMTQESLNPWFRNFKRNKFLGCGHVNWPQSKKFLGRVHHVLKTCYPLPDWKWPKLKAKNDVQDMSINDPLQKISVKMALF